MRKTTLVVLILLASCLSAQAYTVILKNGKVMQGTLVSETSDTVVFEDEDGVRFSLKKATLDLDKMTQANAAVAPEPPPPQPVEQAAASPPPARPKKAARVYTRDDVEKLREKYGELTLGEPVDDPEDYQNGKLKPEAFARRIKQSGERISGLMSELNILSADVATAWEVAQSTGNNPKKALDSVLAKEGSKEAMQDLKSELSDLRYLEERLGETPKGYEAGADSFKNLVKALGEFDQTIANLASMQNATLFRNRIGEASQQISTAVGEIQAWQPQPAEEPQQAATDSDQETQEVEEPEASEPEDDDSSN